MPDLTTDFRFVARVVEGRPFNGLREKLLFIHLLPIKYSIRTFTSFLVGLCHPRLNIGPALIARLCFTAAILRVLLHLQQLYLSRAIVALDQSIQALLLGVLRDHFLTFGLELITLRTGDVGLFRVHVFLVLLSVCFRHYFATLGTFVVVSCAGDFVEAELRNFYLSPADRACFRLWLICSCVDHGLVLVRSWLKMVNGIYFYQ